MHVHPTLCFRLQYVLNTRKTISTACEQPVSYPSESHIFPARDTAVTTILQATTTAVNRFYRFKWKRRKTRCNSLITHVPTSSMQVCVRADLAGMINNMTVMIRDITNYSHLFRLKNVMNKLFAHTVMHLWNVCHNFVLNIFPDTHSYKKEKPNEGFKMNLKPHYLAP